MQCVVLEIPWVILGIPWSAAGATPDQMEIRRGYTASIENRRTIPRVTAFATPVACSGSPLVSVQYRGFSTDILGGRSI